MDTNDIPVEEHPLEPFLPAGARILMLGSFPPPHRRWSMEFFYPNFQNDMWRIMGYVFFGDKDRFVVEGEKRFDREAVEAFCRERGIALYDAAERVARLEGNASDDALQIVSRTDLAALLAAIPRCRAIVVTGTKAAEAVAETLACDIPRVGDCIETEFASRRMRFYRMPSSSRAYPRSVEWKAEFYNRMLVGEGVKI